MIELNPKLTALTKALESFPSSTPICKLEIIGDKVTLRPKASFREQYLGAGNRSINPVESFFNDASKQSKQLLEQTSQLLGKRFSQVQQTTLSQPHATVGGLLLAIYNASGSSQRFSE